MKTVVRIKFGSHLYGTSTPESDIDYKAVHLPDARDILLQRVPGSVCNKPSKKADGEKNAPGDMDEESYSLQRYLQLLVDGQTVAIDMLFAPAPEVTSETWNYIRQNKHRLLTKKSAAFVGYCRTQANKYGIKGSRVAAAKKASEYFGREMFWRPSEKVSLLADELATLCTDEHTRVLEQQVNRDGDMGTFFECCNRKVDFNATIKQAHEIYSRIYQNYGDRARLAQDNEGIDWKALSHAVRVGQEALELLNTGHVTFPLPNAQHILAIKKGLIPYDVVAEEIEQLLEDVQKASETSSLRDEPDQQFIDDLVAQVYTGIVRAQADDLVSPENGQRV